MTELPTAGRAPESKPALARKLGLFDATMLVMGGIVGSGIFINPYVVAQQVHTPTLILGAWIFGGVIGVGGAFIWAELAATLPEVGGQYAYLREAYHPMLAFLYGWVLLLVIQTGGMAAVSITFARYFVEFTGSQAPDWVIAVVALGTLTLINCLGVKTGGRTQSIFMVLKIIAIAGMVIAGAILGGRHETVTTVSGSALVDHILWRGHGTGAVCLWRMADGELPRCRGQRAEEKSASWIAAWSSRRSSAVLSGELGLSALAGPASIGCDQHTCHRGNAIGAGPARRDVYCCCNRDLDSRIPESVNPNRPSRVFCDGGGRPVLSSGGLARSAHARSCGRNCAAECLDYCHRGVRPLRTDFELCHLNGFFILWTDGNDDLRVSRTDCARRNDSRRRLSCARASREHGRVCRDMLVGCREHNLPLSAEQPDWLWDAAGGDSSLLVLELAETIAVPRFMSRSRAIIFGDWENER